MQIAELPQSNGDFAWWGFNILLLVLVAWAKLDLGRINRNIEKNHELTETNTRELAVHKASCEERHKRLDYEIVEIKDKVK